MLYNILFRRIKDFPYNQKPAFRHFKYISTVIPNPPLAGEESPEKDTEFLFILNAFSPLPPIVYI